MKPDNYFKFSLVHVILLLSCINVFVMVIVCAPVHLRAQLISDNNHGLKYAAYLQQDTVRIMKIPRGAMYRSLVFPGWGQWYNEKKFKSVLVFAAETSVIAGICIQHHRFTNSVTEHKRNFYKDDRNKFVWWLGGIILFSMLDAYVDAYLQNFDLDMNINRKNDSITASVTLEYNFTVSTLFHRRNK